MSDHPSLKHIVKPEQEPPTKPLVETAEVREMAKEALLVEVEQQMVNIIHNESALQQLQATLNRIESTLIELRENNTGTNALKLEVLQKLKAKLQAPNTKL